MLITFEPEELERLKEFTRERQKVKDELRAINRKIKPGVSDFQTTYDGFRGELAAAKAIGVEWSPGVHQKQGDGHKGDLILPLDRTAAVKYSRKTGGDFALYGVSPSLFKDSCGILVWETRFGESVADVRGWIPRSRFLRRAIIKNYGYGDRLVCEHQWFSDIAELRELVAFHSNTVVP